MKTMKLQSVLPQSATCNKLLWQKINSFSLDDPNASFPFSKRLAKENKWDDRFTQLAIDEYKKFVYLCCILPNGASPSHTVDQVWHTHLIYTENYWEEFCEKTLGRKLHHHPSTGGQKDQQKHEAWRNDTLKNYELYFGSIPPTAIWEQDKAISKPSKKTIFQIIRQYLLPLILLPFLVLPGCSEAGFMTFGSLVIIFILMIAISANATSDYDLSEKNKKTSNDGGGYSCGGMGGGCSSGGDGGGGGGGCGGGGCGGGGCGGCGGS